MAFSGARAVAVATAAVRNVYRPGAEILIVATMVCSALACVAYAVRRARLRVDAEGISWGWSVGGFRMGAERIDRVELYGDGIAGVPTRGGRWFLSARDWDRFERMPDALRRAQLPVIWCGDRAPLRARIQGYGLALDILLLADAMLATAALGLAVGM